MREHHSQHADTFASGVHMTLRMVVQAPDSYGFVLVLLLASFLLTPLAQGLEWLWVHVLVQGATMVFALHTSRVRRRTMLLVGTFAVAALLLALPVVVMGARAAQVGALEILIALLLGVTVPAILRHILASKTVDGETILGALDVYIIFGLFFSAIFAALDAFSATPFFGTRAAVNSGSYQFFSFVTLTTVGYGNLVPATQVGQSLAVLEALVGQIYLVTLVARLVSGFKRGSRRRVYERLAAERVARNLRRGDRARDGSNTPNSAQPPQGLRDGAHTPGSHAPVLRRHKHRSGDSPA